EAEALGQVRGSRRRGVGDLIAESAMVPRVRALEKRVHVLLQFVGKLPNLELLESRRNHAAAGSNAGAAPDTPHPAPRTRHPAPGTSAPVHPTPAHPTPAHPAPSTQHLAPDALYSPRMFFRGQIVGKYKVLS